MRVSRVILFMAIFVLNACAVFRPGGEPPEVSLSSVQALEREGLEQRFLVGLHIVNPSNSSLNISGMSYTLRFNGRKVASGVSAGPGVIAPYSESRIKVEASTNLLSGLRVITDLLRNPQPVVEYQLDISLRKAWWPVPLKLSEQGSIELGDLGLKARGLLNNE